MTYTRAERLEQIGRLAGRGLNSREIAERLGLARSTVNIYRADPDGRKQRKRRERYRGLCGGCGRPTSGSDGPRRAPERCRTCAGEHRRSWNERRVIEAIRDWQELTGAPPTVADWSPAHAPAGHEGCKRYSSEPGRWPSASTVVARFGSMPAALEAAGLNATASPRWDLKGIAEAMRRHLERTGGLPRRTDWHYAGEDHPSASTVYRVAGSWRRAAERADMPHV